MRQSFHKSFGKRILIISLIVGVLTFTTFVMIELEGKSVNTWKEWCYQARYGLLFWRLVIYIVMIKVWLSLRKQLEQNTFSHRKIFFRLELWFICLVALTEYCNYQQLTQGGSL